MLTDADANAALSFRNLQNVHVLPTGELNAYDVLVSDYVVFSQEALPTAEAAVKAKAEKLPPSRGWPAAAAANERPPIPRRRMDDRAVRKCRHPPTNRCGIEKRKSNGCRSTRRPDSPVVSEKSYGLLEDNVYTFIVRPDATKPEIKQAVETTVRGNGPEGEHAEPQGKAHAQPP